MKLIITLQIFFELLWGSKASVLVTMKIINLTDPIHGRGPSIKTLRFHPVHLSTIHVRFFRHLYVTPTSQIKLLKLYFYDAWWFLHLFPQRDWKWVVRCGFLVLVTPGLGQGGLQMEAFVEGGLPFILGCKQPEQLYYQWVIYSLLPKPSSALFHGHCYQRFPVCLVPLIFAGTADQRKELWPWASVGWLSHVMQMGTCQPSSPDVVLTIDFFAAHYCCY